MSYLVMNSNIEYLLNEIAKPVSQFNKSNILRIISTLDARIQNDAPMIYFLLDSLFDFIKCGGYPISMNELVKSILGNATILPVLYQNQISSNGQDPELDQIIAFINSFKENV